MSRSPRALAHARRDAGLHRLRMFNRMLIGGAVAATGLLTDVTAHAFPGHKRPVTASGSRAPAPAPVRAPGTEARHLSAHHARHRRRAALRPPAHAPTRAAGTTPQVTTTSAAPAPQPAPAPSPAPAPTVSGGS
jgi:hypothetical protein